MNAVGRPFQWTTQDGEVLPVSEMTTRHIYHALRMIFNHTAPESYRIEGGRYSGPENWPIEYRRRAVRAFSSELSRRPDLEPWMKDGLNQMAKAFTKQIQ